MGEDLQKLLVDSDFQAKLGICLVCFFCVWGIFSFVGSIRRYFFFEYKRPERIIEKSPYYDNWD